MCASRWRCKTTNRLPDPRDTFVILKRERVVEEAAGQERVLRTFAFHRINFIQLNQATLSVTQDATAHQGQWGRIVIGPQQAIINMVCTTMASQTTVAPAHSFPAFSYAVYPNFVFHPFLILIYSSHPVFFLLSSGAVGVGLGSRSPGPHQAERTGQADMFSKQAKQYTLKEPPPCKAIKSIV